MSFFKYLKNEDITIDAFKGVKFFSFAEGGAMGKPGELEFIRQDKAMLRCNYVYGGADLERIIRAFPALRGCRFGMAGINSTVPEGWHYVNLGAGNHLVVADDVYDQFEKLTEHLHEWVDYYLAWHDVARQILGIPAINVRTGEYIFFWQLDTDNDYLSNWYPFSFTVEGIEYANVEQYMMAKKALLAKDTRVYNAIMKTSDPSECKRLGRQAKGFDSKKWDACKSEILYRANYEKFSQHYDLKRALIDTGDAILAEASPLDTIWGIGLSADDPNATDQTKWRGQNLLGQCLMKVRDQLYLEELMQLASEKGTRIGVQRDPDNYEVSDDQAEAMDKLLKRVVGANNWAEGETLVRYH